MSNKKQTAVEWLAMQLYDQMKGNDELFTNSLIQAKAIEKDQHSETFNQGVQWMQYQRDLVNGGAEYWDKEPSHFGEYYKETFGSPE
jgi:hypothetical protein